VNKKQNKLNAKNDETEKNKFQEALKSKQIEIKRMRTEPKTNSKWRTTKFLKA
jgi:hypothetical protein